MNVSDLPIKVLDRLIANEMKRNDGFTVYNRGEDLRSCLIDSKKLKSYVENEKRQNAQKRLLEPKRDFSKKRGRSRLPTKITTKGDPEWENMMEFFKENPAALMEALPAPPGS